MGLAEYLEIDNNIPPKHLQEKLKISSDIEKKVAITTERIQDSLPEIRKAISFFREYPDIFIDFLCGDNPENFKLYFYQRVFLRSVMRHRYTYATFPRAFSKSFLSIMVLMIRCILFPGSHAFITTGGKEQAAGIAKEKIGELCKLIPGLNREINWDRGKTKSSKDNVEIIFRSGSVLDIMAAKDSSRGKRATMGLMEEVILIDQKALNEIIIPTMNVDRRLPDGTRHPEEVVNKSQIYITTAGWKQSFAYEKLMQILIQQIIEPSEACVLGGTWRIPVMEGLLQKSFIQDLKLDGTYNDASFDREYESIWSGDAENAYFSADKFDKRRVLELPEYEYRKNAGDRTFYILSLDVGRKADASELQVFKVTPTLQGYYLKTLVFLDTWENMHFEDQCINVKKLFAKYQAKRLVIDGNGMGIGLVDYLIKPSVDNETGEYYPPFGIYNDEENYYRQYITPDTIKDAVYIIKANAPINTEAYVYAQAQLNGGHVRFLVDEIDAKSRLMTLKKGQAMTAKQKAEYLKPFQLTSILKEQMLNLVEDNEGMNIILKRASRGIRKDKFSAFVYALYYIKKEEETRKKKYRRSISDYMFYT